MTTEIPEGWTEARIGDIVLPFQNIDPTKEPEKAFTYVDISSIDNQNQVIRDPKILLGKDAPSRARRRVKAGDVLFSTVRTYLKNIAMVPEELDGSVTSTGIAVLRPNEQIESGYLFNWTRSPEFLARISGAMDGTLYPAVTDRDVLNETIPLPPLPEQRRIVARLDTLLGHVRRARAELARVPGLIERQKQAVLAQAFSGELTADLRTSERISFSGPWDIPENWHWGTFADIADIASNLVAPSEVLDLPHIAPNHIESGVPKLLPFRTVREDGVISAKHRFFPGQVIYSKIRPYLRKAVLVEFEGVCSADMYPITVKGDSKYLLYWLISPGFDDLIAAHQGRTVLPKINQNSLYKIATPIPPKHEQEAIGVRIETAFARIERSAAEAAQAAALLDRMEQATLAQAFRGEL